MRSGFSLSSSDSDAWSGDWKDSQGRRDRPGRDRRYTGNIVQVGEARAKNTRTTAAAQRTLFLPHSQKDFAVVRDRQTDR